jgi:hypothetical protein
VPFLNIPIIDQLVHPSIGLLSRVAVPGNPQAGPFIAVAPPQNPLIALTYGVVLRINIVGAKHGRDVSFPIVYDPPLGRIAVSYTDLSGLQIIRQVTDWLYDDQDFMWEEPLPALVTVYTQPDVSLNLFWLQT